MAEVTRLSNNGYFNVAIDCPGYGRSYGDRQTIRSYPGEFLSAVVRALGRRSVAAMVGSSQGAASTFNCTLERPKLASCIAVVHPVSHAPERFQRITQPCLAMYDRDDRGHPISVGRRVRKLLGSDDIRYFEFASSHDGDWDAVHLPPELVTMLEGHRTAVKRRGGGAKLSDSIPYLARCGGGLRAYTEQLEHEIDPFGGDLSVERAPGVAVVEEEEAEEKEDEGRCEADGEGKCGGEEMDERGTCGDGGGGGGHAYYRNHSLLFAPADGSGSGGGGHAGGGGSGGGSESEDEEDIAEKAMMAECAEAEAREIEASQYACDLCMHPLVQPLRSLRLSVRVSVRLSVGVFVVRVSVRINPSYDHPHSPQAVALPPRPVWCVPGPHRRVLQTVPCV
mmetsp:Transcript_105903/g.306328  ORF Transcript_105903/g.306328 Transcript_105903/m.306328 type:complete len:394 (+) Transcript_105903:127-1308(+)